MTTNSPILGSPLPQDPHAVSVSLPTWKAVCGYEEGDPNVCSQLQTGYPRFKIHSYVEMICQELLSSYTNDYNIPMSCMVWPNERVAERCIHFLKFGGVEVKIEVERIKDTPFYVTFFPTTLKAKAKSYWQHSGEVISSRQAATALQALGVLSMNDDNIVVNNDPVKTLKQRIIQASMHSLHVDDDIKYNSVFITISGMAAIYNTLRLIRSIGRDGIIVVFGFPYLDTLKIMQRPEFNSSECLFLGRGDEKDIEDLKGHLEKESPSSRVAAVFTEFPSNPLLRTNQLPSLVELSRKHGFLLCVDDTIASYANVDLLGGPVRVDIVCTSLTKVFSGVGNVMGGSIIVNPSSPQAVALRSSLLSESLAIPELSFADALVLEENSRKFEARVYGINANALELAKRLQADPRIGHIYYPGVANDGFPDEIFKSMLRTDVEGRAGYGCLLSLLLADVSKTEAFFDALDVNKGPSLGTNFTLACPYTLLAHYQELDWASSFGVDKHIIRVSVGLEDIEDICNRFVHALDVSHNN